MKSADLILANRSYLDHDAAPGEEPVKDGGRGGLLAALGPVTAPWKDGSGTEWVGAARGPHDRAFVDADGFELIAAPGGALRHRRLFFDDATWRGHYEAVSNSFLWPLLHLMRLPLPDLAAHYPAPIPPSDEEWEAYRSVNRAFAQAALEAARPTCWVHDYQLALVPAMLRQAGYEGRTGFFLHTPFSDLGVAQAYLDATGRERFREFVRGILGASLVGMQTEGDCARFAAAAMALAGAERYDGGLRVDRREVRLGAYPVGIDVDELVAVAREAELPPAIGEVVKPGKPLVAGLERADFTKGIPLRLRAVARTFQGGIPFTYVGVAAPTREGVPAYHGLEDAVTQEATQAERAAREAGGAFLQLRRALPWRQVVALQRHADVVFTSSLADGMNLVALQAVAAQSLRPPGERGVIIAGRDAGVASTYEGFEADGLVTVDPLDIPAMTQTLAAAVRGELPGVSDRLIAAVRERDARSWATRFLRDLEETTC